LLEIIPLGGLGEFGMNLMVYRVGDDCLVVDAGMMFPGAEHLGIDVVIPDLSFLEDCGAIHGVILTHGHEDHLGAIPFLLERHDVPVHGTPFSLGLLRRRLTDRGFEGRVAMRDLPTDGTPVRLGPFAVEALPVAHSIPHSVMAVVRTPAGNVVHTADFKLDPMPLDGVGVDIAQRLERVGDEGVLALLSDSTNADVPGFTPGERSVAPALEGLIAGAPRRVFVTSFASNVHRIQQVAGIAARCHRRVALVGSSMIAHAEVAERLGLLSFPAGTRVDAETAMNLRPGSVLFLVTGSQGEPMSALARIAVDRHREVRIDPGDLVIHSARVIPGNAKSIGRMLNHLLRRGAETVTGDRARVHVSGHPAREELRLVLNLVRPRYFIPIHGEYRQLASHLRLARDTGLERHRGLLVESGDLVAVRENECVVRDRVHVGQVFIDAGMEEVDLSVLRDRRRIAGDGVVVPVVALDRERGLDTVEIVSRGFLADSSGNGVMGEVEDLTRRLLDEATPEERTDEGVLRARIQTELKRFLRRRVQKRPLILPVILEL
jgi:ribonuclease J